MAQSNGGDYKTKAEWVIMDEEFLNIDMNKNLWSIPSPCSYMSNQNNFKHMLVLWCDLHRKTGWWSYELKPLLPSPDHSSGAAVHVLYAVESVNCINQFYILSSLSCSVDGGSFQQLIWRKLTLCVPEIVKKRLSVIKNWKLDSYWQSCWRVRGATCRI